MTDKPRFHVIDGTSPPDTPAEQVRHRVRAMPKPEAMVQCHRCGGREVVVSLIGVMMKNGKPSGGTKALLCVVCLLKGERVVIA